jgi:glucan biosynthesis protein C
MTASPPAPRRYDLDWLRVLVILVVFVFHCGRFFDTDGWHVKNPVRHQSVTVWTVFLVCWMMPLIFVISGASTFYALNSAKAARFVRDRALRLLVPLLVGMFTHIAFQVYLERLSFGGFKGSFLEFYPRYFKGFYLYGGNFAWMGLHLWYLEVLFVFSVAFLPLFLWLKGPAGSRWLNAALGFFGARAAIYLLALPPMVLIAWLNPQTFWGQRGFGGWPLIIYIFYFFYGFIIVALPEMEEEIQKLHRLSLNGAVLLFLVLLVVWRAGGDPKYGSLRYWLLMPCFALSSWCFVLAFLGLGHRWLGFTNSFVRYSNEAVLPFYALHQTIILSVGYLVVRWAIPDPVKFVLIALSSFVIIVTIYEFLVRRNNVMRFLFGMRMPVAANIVRPTESTAQTTSASFRG